MNNPLLNDNLIMEEINKEIKGFIEISENENTSYQNMWDAMKAVLRGKFIVLSSFIKKLERSHTGNLTAHLKPLEQKEVNTPEWGR